MEAPRSTREVGFIGSLRIAFLYILFVSSFCTDNESPLIRYCPESSIHLTQEKEDVRVSWIEPTATDNSGSVQLRSNYKPGDWFSLGSTKVTYVAQDEAGHQAECSFEIVVQEIPGRYQEFF